MGVGAVGVVASSIKAETRSREEAKMREANTKMFYSSRTFASSRLRVSAVFLLLQIMSTATLALADPHAADMRFIDNGTIRLGVDLNLGGAITWISKSGSDENVVNSRDWGRQVQMSHYGGPVPFTPGGKQPKPAWRGLGWNPIQSGDAFGNASKTLDSKCDEKSIYVKCKPMQWPLDNVPGDCVFECWLTLDGNVVRARCRATLSRDDKTAYPARDQECPAVYTNGPYCRLITYTGDKPFTGGETTEITGPTGSKFPWHRFEATEGWAAQVNAEGFGLGVVSQECVKFLGGFHGKLGAGAANDDPTGYIAPIRKEVLPPEGATEFEYALVLGRVEDVRALAKNYRSGNSTR